MKQEYVRATVVTALGAGMPPATIISQLKISKKVVYGVKKELDTLIACGGEPDEFPYEIRKSLHPQSQDARVCG